MKKRFICIVCLNGCEMDNGGVNFCHVFPGRVRKDLILFGELHII